VRRVYRSFPHLGNALGGADMSDDPKAFAKTAADALRTYADTIGTAYWYQPDPDNPHSGNVELMIPDAEDMAKALPIIARFLEDMFEEGGTA